jgi:hypothetical protein
MTTEKVLNEFKNEVFLQIEKLIKKYEARFKTLGEDHKHMTSLKSQEIIKNGVSQCAEINDIIGKIFGVIRSN